MIEEYIRNDNEHYIAINASSLEQTELYEQMVLKGIKELFMDDIAPLAPALSTKIHDLLELFKDSDKPIRGHYTVALESEYLLKVWKDRMASMLDYYAALKDALVANDEEKQVEILRDGIKKKKMWHHVEEYVANFDLQENLEDALNSGIPFTKKHDNAKLEAVCKEELQKVKEKKNGNSI